MLHFDFSTVPIVESAEPAPQPESADPPQVAAVEESPTLTPPLPQERAAENSKGNLNTCCTHSTTVHMHRLHLICELAEFPRHLKVMGLVLVGVCVWCENNQVKHSNKQTAAVHP